MFTILATLAPIFGIMLLGAFAERRHILPPTAAACLNQFVYWFSLPLLLFHQLARMRPEQIPPGAASGYLLGLGLALAASYALSVRVLKDGKKEGLMVALLGSFPNAAFMGMPVILLLFPGSDEAALVASLAVVLTSANLLLVDTVLDMGQSHSQSGWQAAWQVLRSLYHNPIMVCSALGATAGLVAVPVPDALMIMTRMIGSTAAPCALFCMGMSLAAQLSALPGRKTCPAAKNAETSSSASSLAGNTSPWGQWRRQLPIHAFKLFISPVLVFALAWLWGERGVPLAAATVMAAMPTGVVAYVLAEKYRAAVEDTSMGIVVNTLLSVLSLPLVIAATQWATGNLP